ncbi:hypothetical protein MAR_018681 [Mya arenaria]|uniref:SMB domain-containing protein n=1 Tax=Mya arenaria TaxID=6604 RepID=A0ABY7EJ90_MYAAR|nr:hypothetical protein MAR_018681 [Mya arenaria]
MALEFDPGILNSNFNTFLDHEEYSATSISSSDWTINPYSLAKKHQRELVPQSLSKIAMSSDDLMLVAFLVLFPSSVADDFHIFSHGKNDSDTCAGRWTCGSDLTYSDINCHCDELWVIMNDCCDDFVTEQSFERTTLGVNADQFSCERHRWSTPR